MKLTNMRFFVLAGFLAVSYAQSGSLECYGDYNYNDGGYDVVTCECQVEELGRFLNHLGYQCFDDGLIPADDENGYFCDGKWNKCSENDNQNCECYQNDNNNNGQEVEPEQEFWCECLGSYLKKYGKFAEGCWLPMLSEAMREVAGRSLEAAWDANGCEWFDFQELRVVPDDVSIQMGDGNSLGWLNITTDTDTWASVVNLAFDYEGMEKDYKNAVGSALSCADPNEEDNGDDDEYNYDDAQDIELAWEIRTAWNYTVSNTGQSVTKYGEDCSQEHTGDVFVGWSYPTEIDGDGYEEMQEREVFVGDMSELYGMLAPNENNGKCCANVYGNNNNNNDNGDDEAESVENADASLASAFAYKFYNKDDIDQYSIVISCAIEAESEEDNNNNNQEQNSQDCMYDDKEACLAVKSKYAIPIMCANFFVGLDVDRSDDVPVGNGGQCAGEDGKDMKDENNNMIGSETDCETAGGTWTVAPDYSSGPTCTVESIDNQTECESSGHTWSSSKTCLANLNNQADCEGAGGRFEEGGSSGGGNGDNNGGGEELEAGDGQIVMEEALVTVKTVAIVILALATTAFCCLWFTNRSKGGYNNPNEVTPLATDGKGEQL